MSKVLLAFLLALCLPAFAESQVGTSSASARLNITVVVPPVNVVQSVTPVPQGLEYRGWTNQRTGYLGGTYVTYPPQPGPYSIVIPALTLQALQYDNINLGTISSP